MVRAFDFFNEKTENFRQKKWYASRLETTSVIKIVTENGTVRHGTVLSIKSDSLLHISFVIVRVIDVYIFRYRNV
jgi:hypothetical protein